MSFPLWSHEDDEDDDDYVPPGASPSPPATGPTTRSSAAGLGGLGGTSVGLGGLQQYLQQQLINNNGTIPADIMQLLARSGIRIVVNPANADDEEDEDAAEDAEDDDEDEDPFGFGFSSSYNAPTSASAGSKWFEDVTEPVPAGEALLQGGEFGRLGPLEKDGKGMRKSTVRQCLRNSKMQRRLPMREDIGRHILPNTSGTIVAKYDANPYAGQYSSDSSFYYTCSQDFRLHIYDTSAPPLMEGNDVQATGDGSDHETTMRTMKSINGAHGNWTITDSHLSPDNERMIYSSINTTIHMTRTRDETNEQIPIQLADRGGRRGGLWGSMVDNDSFGIYSCRFSADGTEIIAGGSSHLIVYDLNAMRRTVKIRGHEDDVNSCCWADSSSGNVLVSASDDTFLKVWDRRSLGASATPAGVLVGHTEGITYVSPKGDGRYVISNGKDQTMRLWDLRKMRTHSEWESYPNKSYGLGNGWDYRRGTYRKPRYDAHPRNCSVMAYRGHHVFKTLIRCHFSPQETTGSSYLYTGSADGKIHIYSLDGRIVQVLDRAKALPMSFDPSESEPPLANRSRTHASQPRARHSWMAGRTGVVRDVSWHSREPVLMSVAWGSGSYDGGTVARNEWKGMGRNGMTLEDVIERDRANAETAPGQSSPVLPGSFPSDFMNSVD